MLWSAEGFPFAFPTFESAYRFGPLATLPVPVHTWLHLLNLNLNNMYLQIPNHASPMMVVIGLPRIGCSMQLEVVKSNNMQGLWLQKLRDIGGLIVKVTFLHLFIPDLDFWAFS